MTNKQLFFNEMKNKGFQLYKDLCGTLPLNPTNYKTNEGDHVNIGGVGFVDYGGSDTKDGELGCVIFCYTETRRRKYQRHWNTNTSAEILKKVLIPKNANHALAEFETWYKDAQNTIKKWELV